MKFDKNKTYKLRNGSRYRNYCADSGGWKPIGGAYFHEETSIWVPINHTEDLFFIDSEIEHDFDLIEDINVPWFENIPSQGVLCFVDNSPLIVLIKGYENGNFSDVFCDWWDSVTPLTMDEVKEFIYEYNIGGFCG